MDILRGSQLKTEERQGSQGPRQMTQISAHRLLQTWSDIHVANWNYVFLHKIPLGNKNLYVIVLCFRA